MKYDKDTAEELSKLKKENGDIGKQTLSMTNANSITGKITRLVFGNEELKKALAKVAVVKEVATSMVDKVMKGRGSKKPLDKVKETATKLELPTVQDVAKAGLSK